VAPADARAVDEALVAALAAVSVELTRRGTRAVLASVSMRGWLACVLIGLVAAAVPTYSDACSFPCGLSIERPENGQAHAANAALHILACSDYAQAMLSVTVDGVPASLGSAVPGPDGSDGRMSISPAPAPGQEVVIVQCGEEAPTYGRCPDPPEPVEVLRYVAGPDDLEPPPGAGTVTITHTYGLVEEACYDGGDVQFHLELTGLDQGSETAVLYRVVLETGRPDGYGAPRRTEWVGPEAVTSLSFDIAERLELASIPPDDTCATVTAMDLAGHVTTIAETCGSVATNAPPAEGDGSSSGGEDPSGSADTSTGGLPVDATATGSEPADTGDPDLDADTTDRGCACAASPRSVPSRLSLLLLVLLCARRLGSSSRAGRGAGSRARAASRPTCTRSRSRGSCRSR
jgi:hypothetical protein